MLELLAGPFPLVDLNGDPFPDNTELSIIGARGYDDRVGIMANSTTKTYSISMDGVVVVLSDTDRTWYIVDLSDYPLIHPRKMEVADRLFYDKVYPYNKDCGVRQNPASFEGATGEASTMDVKLPDRYIGISATKVYTKPHDMSGESALGTQEASITKGPWSGAEPLIHRAIVSMTNDKEIVAGVYPDGTIIYYNHITKTQVQKWDFIGPNKGAWYSERSGVWLRWGTDNQIAVYATTARPYALSTPTGDAPLKGRPQEYSVTLTGEHLEPIPDEIVEWSLGEGGEGYLTSNQSKTDAAGLARVDYVAPVGTLGSAIINAAVRY